MIFISPGTQATIQQFDLKKKNGINDQFVSLWYGSKSLPIYAKIVINIINENAICEQNLSCNIYNQCGFT